MIWLLSLLSLLTKKTNYHCLWYDTEVTTSMDIKFKFLKRGYILAFKYTINHFLLSQGGSSSFYSVFRSSILQNFEEYVVTVPWWKDLYVMSTEFFFFFLSHWSCDHWLVIHLEAVITYCSKIWGILPLKTV